MFERNLATNLNDGESTTSPTHKIAVNTSIIQSTFAAKESPVDHPPTLRKPFMANRKGRISDTEPTVTSTGKFIPKQGDAPSYWPVLHLDPIITSHSLSICSQETCWQTSEERIRWVISNLYFHLELWRAGHHTELCQQDWYCPSYRRCKLGNAGNASSLRGDVTGKTFAVSWHWVGGYLRRWWRSELFVNVFAYLHALGLTGSCTTGMT